MLNSGTVSILGEVFDVEVKELRNGKVLLIACGYRLYKFYKL